MIDYIKWFLNVKIALNTWETTHLVMLYAYFFTFWIWYGIFFEDFFLYVHERYWPLFFLCHIIFIWIFISVVLNQKNELCVPFASSMFWKKLENYWYNFLLKCLIEFTSETIWPWHFLFGSILVYISFRCNLIHILYFSLCE